MCRRRTPQGRARAGAGCTSIEGGGSAASIEGANAPYGRKVRQPLKGCALTKIGSANASIPFQFPTKEQGTLTIEGVDAPYAKAIPAIP